MSKRFRRAAAATAAAALVLSGCTSGEGHRSPGGHIQHKDGDEGPLSIGGPINGGATFDAVKAPVWVGTYGSFKLCSRGGAKAVLEGVRLAPGVKPRSVIPWLRTVTAAEAAPSEANGRYVLIAATTGTPPRFDEPYVRDDGVEFAGAYTDKVRGVVINRDCEYDYQKDGYDELLVAIEVDKRGASSDYFWIDYKSGGKKYALRVDWKMVLCGSAVEKSECEMP